jgi:CDP-paratose 2-epimerase
MKFLVTGGCGFLGSNLAAAVLKNSDELTVLDNLGRVGATENLIYLQSLGKFDFQQTDIRDATAVANLVQAKQPDVIFHLAGQVAMTTSLANPRSDFEINALGTLNVLEAAREFSPHSSVIYSSTNKVYGDLEWTPYEEHKTRYITPEFPNGFPETVPLEFHSPYGCSKGAADQYMLDYARMFDLNTIVFRHSSMFGGRQFSTADQGWIGWFCGKAIEAASDPAIEPFTICGNGKQVRDVLHADDMVRLYFAAATNMNTARGHAFNIGGGVANSLSLLELFDVLEQEVGVKLRYINLPPRSSDQRVFIADVSKAKQLLNWEPKVDYRAGIRSMLDWVSDYVAN